MAAGEVFPSNHGSSGSTNAMKKEYYYCGRFHSGAVHHTLELLFLASISFQGQKGATGFHVPFCLGSSSSVALAAVCKGHKNCVGGHFKKAPPFFSLEPIQNSL